MIDNSSALKIMRESIDNENLRKHCLATQVVMKFLAQDLGEDEKKWSLTGLLHDIDYVETADNPEKHSLIAAKKLKQIGLPEDVVYAVKVHNDMHNFPRKSILDKALYAADPLTGLIVAATLIKPERKIRAIDVAFLLNRFNEKSFARGACRQQIATCEEIGLSLEEFMSIGLKAMQSIEKELGL